jgi:hypothetical protein
MSVSNTIKSLPDGYYIINGRRRRIFGEKSMPLCNGHGRCTTTVFRGGLCPQCLRLSIMSAAIRYDNDISTYLSGTIRRCSVILRGMQCCQPAQKNNLRCVWHCARNKCIVSGCEIPRIQKKPHCIIHQSSVEYHILDEHKNIVGVTYI